MSKPRPLDDADLARLYEFCRADESVYAILRRLVSYGVAPESRCMLAAGKSYRERLKDVEATVPGDVWIHRKTGRTATVLATDGRNIKIRHQLGQVTTKWCSYLASDFEKRESP